MIGGLSMTELIIILGLALLLLGPDQLPNLAKSLGKGLREIRKATDDLKGQFEKEMVNLEDLATPRNVIAPVPPPATPAADDPAAARANARLAASTPPPPEAADDPAGARAAARRAAATSAGLKLVQPEGTVPREGPPAPPAAEPAESKT